MTQLVLSVFPGIDLLGRGFEAEGFCVVRGPDLLWGFLCTCGAVLPRLLRRRVALAVDGPTGRVCADQQQASRAAPRRHGVAHIE